MYNLISITIYHYLTKQRKILAANSSEINFDIRIKFHCKLPERYITGKVKK